MRDDTLLADEQTTDVSGADEAPETEVVVDRLVAERDEYLDTLQRVQAELENFRKRTQRDQDAVAVKAAAKVIDTLLPVLDAIDAARTHDPDALAPIDAVLHPALVTLGVVRIDPVEEDFDPQSHEAVAVDDPDGDGALVVVEVLRPGYRCRDQLLRPAMVRVGSTEG